MMNEKNQLKSLLHMLAHNLWWSWNPGGRELFETIAGSSWEEIGRNPVKLLARLGSADMERIARDPGLSAQIVAVADQFQSDMAAAPDDSKIPSKTPVAYFCAEYGLHESLRIYSGGLGVLAGDHIKSASDLRLPLVAIGLFYKQGFFTQSIDETGRQIAQEAPNVPPHLPLERLMDGHGDPLTLRVRIQNRWVAVGAWVVRVGRVPLFLLDTDVAPNSREEREITARLYPSDPSERLQQEIVLGMAGTELLHALGITPGVVHLNEGHAALACLQRFHHLVRENRMSREDARRLIQSSTVFTTHTPVPAGHDRFSLRLFKKHLGSLVQQLGLPWHEIVALGQAGGETGFNMSYLAIHFSGVVNGVSQLHAEVSRDLLRAAWPGTDADDVPIIGITNGVHLPTWVGDHMTRLLTDGTRRPVGEDFQDAARRVDDCALWRLRQTSRTTLVHHLQSSFELQRKHGRLSELQFDLAMERLTSEALFIGFARRFTAYKRGSLMFHDPKRLHALLSDPLRPVCLLVAGKAHPADVGGQEILAEVYRWTMDPDFAGRVIVLENYEMDIARILLHGVDIWLNTPTRGLEASGTSGMKAAANGALNLSIADGWWLEGAVGGNGWILGDIVPTEDSAEQDRLDADALYRLLEQEIIPEYFDRDQADLPGRWLQRIRVSMNTIPPQFDTHRMVGDYVNRAYAPLLRYADHRTEDFTWLNPPRPA